MNTHTVPAAWLFDVDGVLVHIEEHRIVEIQLIHEIITHLSHHEPIALISGRSAEWQKDNVITLIHQEFTKTPQDPSLLDNLYISGEFGGTAIEFVHGKEVFGKDTSLLIPQDLLADATEIAKPFQGDIVIEPKQTIFTIFAHSIHQYNQVADTLLEKFQKLVKHYHLQDEIEVHRDTISINIRHKKATKHYATHQFLSWLKRKNINPQHYYAFGDSASDIQIGEELAQRQLPFTFVFVGLPEKLPGHLSFPVVETQERFDKGTVAFLKSVENI